MHSAILMIMAFDHYIAICNPLRYPTILTLTRALDKYKNSQEHTVQVGATFFHRAGHHLSYLMSEANSTDFTNPSTFILLGIPGLEAAHVWISIPFCTMYIIAILGNFTILFIVTREPSLHRPMHYFLCMLAVNDLVLSTIIVPKTLSIFWFDSTETSFNACLTQMYFVHCFTVVESGILVAMAVDRYHIAVVTLACGDIRVSNYYGLFMMLFVAFVDMCFITASYTQIFRAIFSLRTMDARCKTFGTCSTQLCAILVFFIPDVVSSVIHRFDYIVPPHVLILIANVHLVVPSMLHPIIYGIRTKEIRDRLLWVFTHKKI
nr:olfactory receptor 52K2-like [Pelodiscus sinensis]|eukprot:XP_025043997.1 olfactory receptor 52K2-like [Pelodiscus sinensis]